MNYTPDKHKPCIRKYILCIMNHTSAHKQHTYKKKREKKNADWVFSPSASPVSAHTPVLDVSSQHNLGEDFELQVNTIGIFLNKCKDPPNFWGHHTSKSLKAESQAYKKHVDLVAISL